MPTVESAIPQWRFEIPWSFRHWSLVIHFLVIGHSFFGHFHHRGANWIRPGSLKRGWRAVVGQQAT
jgi:hypothetical protein